MIAARLTAPGQLKVEDVPAPVLGAGDSVLVRVRAVGICGSDVHNYVHGGIGARKVVYPFIPGHEASGEILAVGSEVKGMGQGTRVMIEPAMHCGHCDQCVDGHFNTCRQIQFLSSAGELQGCMCEQVVVPAHNCFPIPDSVSFEAAAFAEPLSIAIYSVQQSIPLSANTPVVILGAGPIGLSTLLAVRQSGAQRIYMTDRIPERLSMGAELGACWTGNPDQTDIVSEILARESLGIPVVFECCGKQDAIDQGIRLLKPRGKLVITGIPEGSRITMNIDLMRRNELNIYNVRRQNQCVEPALKMIASGAINVNPLITHRFALAASRQAFDTVANYADGVIKAMVVC